MAKAKNDAAVVAESAAAGIVDVVEGVPSVDGQSASVAPDANVSGVTASEIVVEETVLVRVLVSSTIGVRRYAPNDVIGLPASVAKQATGSVDQDPDAVAHALGLGAEVQEYEG